MTSNASIAIQTLLNASASVEQGVAGGGLAVMQDAAGQDLAVVTANGCTATAYRDQDGNVIIAYQGTETGAQLALDQPLAAGVAVATLAGFADAVTFANTVRTQAAAAGIASGRIYVTGHSLGGSLAEYVASETGLAGASFAGSGLGGHANTRPAADFVSFVGLGDPFGNEATDAAEAHYVRAVTTRMDHVGAVALLGDGSDFSVLRDFIAAATADGISVASDPIAALTASGPAFSAAWSQHALAVYAAQIAARYGDVSLAQIAALNGPGNAAYWSDTGSDGSATVLGVADAPGMIAMIDLTGNDAAKVVFGGNAALAMIAGNTTIVLNGAGQNGAVTIESLGGNAVWMGAAAVDYTAGGHSVFILGDAGGASSTLDVHGGDGSARNEFMVWGDGGHTQTIDTDGASASILFGGADALSFHGGGATIVLNGAGQTGGATIDSLGGNTVWAGSAALAFREGGGDDLILLDGSAATAISGAVGAQTGLTRVESIANSGAFTYAGGGKPCHLDLGGGQNSVSGGAAAQTITINGSGTLTVTDNAATTGAQTITVGQAALFRFQGGGNDAAITLGGGQSVIEAGRGNMSLTGGAGSASVDLTQALRAELAFDGGSSGVVDIFGFDPATASVRINDVAATSVAGGNLVVSLADHATITFHGDTDLGHAGIVFG